MDDSELTPETTGTYKIITVVNTAANTTSTSTERVGVYEGFQPPHINSDGTRIYIVSYTFSSEMITATV